MRLAPFCRSSLMSACRVRSPASARAPREGGSSGRVMGEGSRGCVGVRLSGLVGVRCGGVRCAHLVASHCGELEGRLGLVVVAAHEVRLRLGKEQHLQGEAA
jgi:hypothetical protein